MIYSIYARSLEQAVSLAGEKGWDSNQWILYVLDIDEPYARVMGTNAVAA